MRRNEINDRENPFRMKGIFDLKNLMFCLKKKRDVDINIKKFLHF